MVGWEILPGNGWGDERVGRLIKVRGRAFFQKYLNQFATKGYYGVS